MTTLLQSHEPGCPITTTSRSSGILLLPGGSVGTIATITSAQTSDISVQLPSTTGTLPTLTSADTFTNKIITATSNTVAANSLKVTSGGVVTVSGATAPTAGQVLTATSASAASWQNTAVAGSYDPNILYVSSNGTAAGPGTIAAPYDTVLNAIAASAAGDIINVDGDYLDDITLPHSIFFAGNGSLGNIDAATYTLRAVPTPSGVFSIEGAVTLGLNATLRTDGVSVDTITSPDSATIYVVGGQVNNATITNSDATFDKCTLGNITLSATNGARTFSFLNVLGASSISVSGTSTSATSLNVIGYLPTLDITAASSAGVAALIDDCTLTYGVGAQANTTVTYTKNAATTAYAPATPGNWSVVPARVDSALDTLAAKAAGPLYDNATTIVDNADVTRGFAFNCNAGTTSTMTTLLASQTANRSVTFPDATDTIVARATTDTLTNKTITDTTNTVYANALKSATTNVVTSAATAPTVGQFLTATGASAANWQTYTGGQLLDSTTTIVDNADTTRGFAFLADNGTTGTLTTLSAAQTANRTVIFPNASTTLVGADNTATLTNKTITGATNAVDATAIRSATTAVATNASTAPTSGQFLTATSSTNATWQTYVGSALQDASTTIVDNADTTRGFAFLADNGTTGTKTTISAAQTADRTVTLPNATDTIVARATTDTLTNKTITGATNTVDATAIRSATTAVATNASTAPTSGQLLTATSSTNATWQTYTGGQFLDNVTTIVDNADTTRGFAFLADNGTTGTITTLSAAQTANRTVTLPNATDTIVARATTDTLTNKTITDTTNTVYANALKSATTNVIVSAATAPSTGQALIATSSTAATWQTPVSGPGSSTNTAIVKWNGTTGLVLANSGCTIDASDNLNVGGNLKLPTLTTTAGAIFANGNRVWHNFGSANVFSGQSSGNLTLTGNSNSGFGFGTLPALTSGQFNTCIGSVAGNVITSGTNNSILGYDSGMAITTGGGNTLLGSTNSTALITGANNTIIGYQSGTSYTGAETGNILINHVGVVGESNVIRIGSGTISYTATFLRGVRNITPAGANGISVYVDSNGQLGTVGTVQTDTILEQTTDAGVTIDTIRLRTDTLTTPAINVMSIVPVAAATNISTALSVKGTGALVATVADNTATGGNARGTNAVDWQTSRSAATMVANGNYSVIAGGSNNTASGLNSFTFGDNNVASGTYSIAGGRNATASHAGSLVLKDSDSGSASSNATNSALLSYLGGFRLNGGAVAMNDRSFIYSDGTAQTVGAVTSTIYTIATVSNSIHMITYNIVAATSGGDTAVFTANYRVKNVAGTMTVGTSLGSLSDADLAVSAATVAVTTSGTNILVRCTGVAAITLDWRGIARDVSYSF
jgi:hypothetical protein